MSDVAAVSRPDTSDMIGVHRVFRESLAVAPQVIGAVADGDSERVATVAGYYSNVLAFLHVHHEGEDELLWPKLVARCPERADEITRIAAQHGDVLTALEAADARLAEWQEDPVIDRGAALAAALVALAVGLTAHLDEEERTILPIAAEHLTVEEWGQLPAHGMQHFSGDRLWLILGLIREQMTPAQKAEMDAHMPPPVRDFWVNQGEPMFTEFMADFRR